MALTTVRRRVGDSIHAQPEPDETSGRARQFRDVPIPALPGELAVPLEGAERMLGHGLAHAILAKRIERAVGDVVRSTLDSYAAVLRRWALDALDEIRLEWTAATDAMRAHIDRRLGHSQAVSVDRTEIAVDIQRLSTVVAR